MDPVPSLLIRNVRETAIEKLEREEGWIGYARTPLCYPPTLPRLQGRCVEVWLYIIQREEGRREFV